MTRITKVAQIIALLAILATGFGFRAVGLFRGLETGTIFHPDAAKQVVAARNYLQGQYLWYIGNPFYDGYPFFLNHVDEAIVRGAYVVVRPLRALLFSRARPLAYPDVADLYYWLRSLRVLYGMAVLGMGIGIGWLLFRRRGPALAAGALLALAPLSCTVTHFATGDIGVDLFVTASLFALALHAARPRAWLIPLSGVFCGFAFAAKYQGALGFAGLGAYLLALAWMRRLAWRAAAGRLAAGFLGFVIGAVAGTPALFINPARTWKDMRINFVFIKDYGADPAFLEQPFFVRLRHGLIENTPVVVFHLGVALTVLALAAAILLTRQILRRRRADLESDAPSARATALLWALSVFPFGVALLSTALKPSVQPFHFSYLAPPLCMAALFPLVRLWDRRSLAARATAAALFAAAVGISLSIDLREAFFWRRPDTREAATAYAANVLREPLPCPDRGIEKWTIKYFWVEKHNPSVFRNALCRVLHYNPGFWLGLGSAPLPSIPFPIPSRWLFLNGPTFPRNDRAFRIGPYDEVLRDLVAYDPFSTLAIGIRTGMDPARVRIECGGATATADLPPNTQKVLSLSPKARMRVAGAGPDGADVFIAPLRVRSQPGAAWVHVLTDDRDLATFELFGGVSTRRIRQLAEWIEHPEMRRRLNEPAFLRAENREPLTLGTNAVALLSTALPAGRYLLECRIASSVAGDLVLDVRDALLDADPARRPAQPFHLSPQTPFEAGLNVVTLRFAKAFSPHQVDLSLCNAAPESPSVLIDWELRPDVEGLLADYRAFLDEGIAPPWCESPEPATRTAPALGVVFARAVRLVECRFPDILQPGKPFEYALRMALVDPGLPRFEEWIAFVHLRNAQGQTAAAFDLPVRSLTWDDAPLHGIAATPPPDLEPGDYTLAVGFYNGRTFRGAPITDPAGATVDRDAVFIRPVRIDAYGP